MIIEGLNLALFGMGAVFIFLALLILVTKFMSFLLKESEGTELVPSTAHTSAIKQNRPSPSVAKQQDVDDIKIVLAAAIKEFKNRH